MACLGAFLGFRCMSRARAHAGLSRVNWLVLAAVAIGAAGNWAMHFIAMLGVTMTGTQIRYNVPRTIESMVVAIVVVGIGLFVWYGSASRLRAVIGGVIAGIGIAAMHYSGEAAMVIPDSVHYNKVLVAVSVVIAVAAGVASLWVGLRIRRVGASILASLAIGVAITGMHYIAMTAMEMTPGRTPTMSGDTGGSFLFPLVLGISLVTFVLALAISLSPTEEEIAADAVLRSRIENRSRRVRDAEARNAAPADRADPFPPAEPLAPEPATPHQATSRQATRQQATRQQATPPPPTRPQRVRPQPAAAQRPTPPDGTWRRAEVAPSHAAPSKARLPLRDLSGPSRAAALRFKSRVLPTVRRADQGDH